MSPPTLDLLPLDLPPLIRTRVLVQATGLSAEIIRAMARDGRLPPTVRVSKKLFLHRTIDVRRALVRLLEPETSSPGGEAQP